MTIVEKIEDAIKYTKRETLLHKAITNIWFYFEDLSMDEIELAHKTYLSKKTYSESSKRIVLQLLSSAISENVTIFCYSKKVDAQPQIIIDGVVHNV